MTVPHRLGLTTAITNLPRLDPDVALVRQFRATGDPRVFETLFRKYQGPVFHLVSRMTAGEDAYDVTQDVFVRALRALPLFKGDSKFRTWLYAIARNTCLNHLRDSRVQRGHEGYSLDDDGESGEGGSGPEPSDPQADVGRIAEQRELQGIVDKTLAALSPEQRLLITLRDLEGLSYEEIAEITELSVSNVKSKLHRARLAFKTRFAPFLALVGPDSEIQRWTAKSKDNDEGKY